MSNASDTIRLLLDQRKPGNTICPSEAARSLAGKDGEWKEWMLAVHAAVDDLLRDGTIELSWKGAKMEKRSGPYRIGLRRR